MRREPEAARSQDAWLESFSMRAYRPMIRLASWEDTRYLDRFGRFLIGTFLDRQLELWNVEILCLTSEKLQLLIELNIIEVVMMEGKHQLV